MRSGPRAERNWFEHSADDMKLYLPEIFDSSVFRGGRFPVFMFFRPKQLFVISTEIPPMFEKNK